MTAVTQDYSITPAAAIKPMDVPAEVFETGNGQLAVFLAICEQFKTNRQAQQMQGDPQEAATKLAIQKWMNEASASGLSAKQIGDQIDSFNANNPKFSQDMKNWLKEISDQAHTPAPDWMQDALKQAQRQYDGCMKNITQGVGDAPSLVSRLISYLGVSKDKNFDRAKFTDIVVRMCFTPMSDTDKFNQLKKEMETCGLSSKQVNSICDKNIKVGVQQYGILQLRGGGTFAPRDYPGIANAVKTLKYNMENFGRELMLNSNDRMGISANADMKRFDAMKESTMTQVEQCNSLAKQLASQATNKK